MRILLTTFSLFLFFQQLAAQRSKFSIGLEAAPGFYSLKSLVGSPVKYSKEPGLQIAATLAYNSSETVSFAYSTGIFFSWIHYKTDYNFTVLQPNDPAVPEKSDTRAGYLEFPLLFQYKIIKQTHTRLYANAGPVASILIQNKDKTTFADNSVRKSGYLNKQLFSVQLGAGLQQYFNQRLSVKLEPQYRIFLKGLDRFMGKNPTAVYLNIGLACDLK